MMMVTRAVVLLYGCLGIMHLSTVVYAQTDAKPTVRELSAGVDNRISQYKDLKFIYDSRISTRSNPVFSVRPLPPDEDTLGKYVGSREILKLRGQPDWHDIGSLDISWTRFRSGTFGQGKLMDFAVSTKSEVYSFKRLRPGMVRSMGNNDGSVLERSYGTSNHDNLFPSFLFQRVNGITLWDLFPSRTFKPEVWQHRLDEFTLVGQTSIDGQVLYQLKCNIGSPDEASWVEVDMSGAPDFMIYRQEYFHQNKSAEVHRVQEVARVNGIAYPSKGVLHREALGHIHEMNYDYQVTYAGSLTESDVHSWIPSWPSNTLVQEPSARRTYVTSVASPLLGMSQSPRRFVLTLMGSLITMAVFNGLWFAWSPRPFERRLIIFLAGFAIPTTMLAFVFDPVLASLFAWINCVVLLIAIPVRSLFGTTILRSATITSAQGHLEQTTTVNAVRAGLRDWASWILAIVGAVIFTTLLELPIKQKSIAMFSVGCIVLAQIFLINRWLNRSPFWPVSMTTAGSVLLWMFLQVPVTSLFDFPYWERDHVAWQWTFVFGFGLLLATLYWLRSAGHQMGSDKSMANKLQDARTQLGLREIIVWVTAFAILLAIGQLLSRSSYDGF